MNKVLITGATSGIGRQLAQDYASQNWQVIACGRNQQALEELSSQFSNLETVRFDITDIEQTNNALSSMPFTPELWILNAGNCEYIDDGEMDASLLARVFDTNVIGLSNVIQAIQPHLAPGHRVAVVGSIASEVALPRAEAYGASKAAVSYLARALRLDWADKDVEVSTIYPGFVATPLTDKNTFSMPMIITVEEASQAIRDGLSKGLSNIYFPKRFTWILRFIGTLPYSWQHTITCKMFRSQKD